MCISLCLSQTSTYTRGRCVGLAAGEQGQQQQAWAGLSTGPVALNNICMYCKLQERKRERGKWVLRGGGLGVAPHVPPPQVVKVKNSRGGQEGSHDGPGVVILPLLFTVEMLLGELHTHTHIHKHTLRYTHCVSV